MSFNPKDFANAVETTQEVKTAEEMGVQTPQTETVETKAETTEKTEAKVEVKAEEKVETKAEQKPETVVSETKTETTQTEQKKESFFDKFTKPKEAETKVEEKVEIPEAVKQELESAKAELEKYKNSPLAKLLGGDYDLTKVDLKEFLKQAVGEDYSSLSDADLIEKTLTSNPNFDKLTEEEKQEEIALLTSKFDSMGKLEKIEERQKLIDKLSPQNNSELFKTLEEIQANQKNLVDPDKYFEQRTKDTFEQTFNNVKSSISEISNTLVGQEYNGYKVTEESAKMTVDEFVDQTQNFNPEKVAFNLFKATNFDAYGDFMYKKGLEDAMKKEANPSRNEASGTTIPAFKGEKGLGEMTLNDFMKVQ